MPKEYNKWMRKGLRYLSKSSNYKFRRYIAAEQKVLIIIIKTYKF